MSDGSLRYAPIDPSFQPTVGACTQARALLASFLPHSDNVTATRFTGIEFIDPGANWSGVHCSSCGADAEAWWGEAVSEAAEGGFATLDVLAPCCGQKLSLNDLRYVWPAAFSSFVLEAMNPNSMGLSEEQLQRLGRVLGCSVREIARHL